MGKLHSRLLHGLLGIVGLALASPAIAALYGTVGEGATPSTFVEVNPATGEIRTIGPVGYQINGMADGRDGTLYAITRDGDPGCSRGLLRIDPATGAGTPIGCGATLGGNRPVLLTANAAGQLYSWWDPSADDLITWNKVAGTYSAPIGDAGIGTAEHSLAFDLAGTTLYLVQSGSVYTVNTTTGAATLAGPISGYSSVSHHGHFNPDDGLLYAIGCADGCTTNTIVRINAVTRTYVSSSPTAPALHTLAVFGPASSFVPKEIPVDNKWALAAAALLLAAFGGYYMRRRG